jgi:phage regulator Rha-like protein
MFQLTKKEQNELVANCDRFTQWKHSSALPHAFTEAGVAMLSSVLNSDKAIQVNLQIIRAFVRLRKMIGQHEALRLTIESLERRTDKNECDIRLALSFLKEILFPSEKEIPKKPYKMGFVQYRKD